MMRRHVLGALLALVLVGSITLDVNESGSTTSTEQNEVQMGALAPGSTGGTNGSAGSASVTGSLLSQTTNVLYLNNTNASGAYYARLAVTSSSGVANLPTLTIGIDNGTATAAQVLASLGSVTQTTGSYIRLEPSSANKIYVTQTVTLLGLTSSFTMDVYASDDAAESAYATTTATISVT